MGTHIGTIQTITYADGTVHVEFIDAKTTFATLYGSLTAQDSGPGFAIANPDGSTTFVFVGPGGFLTVPGYGVVPYGGTGRFTFTVDAAGNLVSESETPTPVGASPAGLAAICTYLGPPGYQFPG